MKLHYNSVESNKDGSISVVAPGPFQSGDPNYYASEMSACRRDISFYPALAPGCDYLEQVFKNTPTIYPFGLGDELSGPRLWCRAASGFRDAISLLRGAEGAIRKRERHRARLP